MVNYDFSQDVDYLKRKWREDVTDKDTGLGISGITSEWLSIAAESKNENWEIAKAKIFACGCDKVAIGVSKHDWFPAFAPWSFHRGHPCRKILSPRAEYVDATFSPGLRDKIAKGTKNGSWVVWKDYSHCAPDWDDLLQIGFPGIRDRLLKNWKDTSYYPPRLITADAVLRFVKRIRDYAKKVNEETPSFRIEAEVASLERLLEGPPKTAYDVLLFIYLEWVMGENFDCFQVRTLSNLDRILAPYYQNDLAQGLTTEEEFRDQIRHFWWQWGSIDNYYGQPVYLGGTKADGTTEYNEVSRIILEVHDELALPTPKVHIKTAGNTPDWVWRMTLDMARRQRSVTFCGEEPLNRAITSLGYSAEQARKCAIWGCYEWGILDSCNDTIPSYVSVLKPIELMLEAASDGSFEAPTFESFLAQYYQRLENTVKEARELSYETEKWVYKINPSMLFSLSIPYSVETGKDAFHDGTIAGNNSHILMVGLGSAVDSLLAIRELVYGNDKKMSLEELGKVMAANWQGHEELRLRVLRSNLKWGNNSPDANKLGREISKHFAKESNNIPNSRNGRFVSGGHSSRRFVDFGKLTGATPDGRLAGEEISKNLSPAPGSDTEGVTALINTLSSLDAEDMPMDIPLDVMIHPSSVSGDVGLDVMRTLVERYHSYGLTLIQFNVFEASTLRDAQKNPHLYENLQVRVCGWNVRWNDLPPEQQEAYIRRAETVS
mgnify:CR=1 FL=1